MHRMFCKFRDRFLKNPLTKGNFIYQDDDEGRSEDAQSEEEEEKTVESVAKGYEPNLEVLHPPASAEGRRAMENTWLSKITDLSILNNDIKILQTNRDYLLDHALDPEKVAAKKRAIETMLAVLSPHISNPEQYMEKSDEEKRQIVDQQINGMIADREAKEKEIVEMLDNNLEARVDFLIARWENPPELYADRKEKRLKQLKGWKKDLVRLRTLTGKSFEKKLAGLNEEFGYEIKPTKDIKKFANDWEAIEDTAAGGYNYPAKLAQLKKFLLKTGIKPSDLPTIYVVLRELSQDREADSHVNRVALESAFGSLNDNKNPASYYNILRDYRSQIFDLAYGVEFTNEEFLGVAAYQGYDGDVNLRFGLDETLKSMEYDTEWHFEDGKKVIPTVDDLIRRLKEAREKVAAADINHVFGPLLSEMDRNLQRAMKEVNKSTFDQEWKDAELEELKKKAEDLEKHGDTQGNFMHDLDWLDGQLKEIVSIDDRKERDKWLLSLEEGLDQLETELNNVSGYPELFSGINESIEDFIEKVHHEQYSSSQIEWKWMSLYDIYRVGGIVKEWADRRYTRRSEDVLGTVGAKVTEQLEFIRPLKTLPQEFDKRRESAEQQEVNNYKESYTNKDTWEVQQILYTTRNPDEAKACCMILSDLGRLRFDDPQIWATLMRLSGGQVQWDLNNPDRENSDILNIYNKWQRAVGVIWDFDTYRQWKTTNDSNWDSQKNNYKPQCDQLAERPGGLARQLKTLLEGWKKYGDSAKINPHEYEKIVDYAIEMGKMSSEAKLYYIIQGVATGLLPLERIVHIDTWLNNFPAVELFASPTKRGERPTMGDLKEWAQYDYGLNGPGHEFNYWYHSYIMTQEKVQQRTDKTLTQGRDRVDHDDAVSMIGAANSNTVVELVRQLTQGGYTLPTTAFSNFSAGYNFTLHTFSEAYERGDVQNKERELARLMHAFLTFDSITGRRFYSNDARYFRFNEAQLEGNPRMGPVYSTYTGDKSVREYQNDTRSWFVKIDEESLRPFFEEFGARTSYETINAHLKKIEERYGGKIFEKEEDYPREQADVNKILDRFDVIASFIIKNNPDGVRNAFRAMTEEHKGYASSNNFEFNVDDVKQKVKKREQENFKNVYNYYFDSSTKFHNPSHSKSQSAGGGEEAARAA